MAKDVEDLFLCRFAIYVFSLAKFFLFFPYHFLTWVFVFLLSFESSLYIISTSPLADSWSADIFFQSVVLPFHVSQKAEVFDLDEVQFILFFFPSMDCPLFMTRTSLADPMLQMVSPVLYFFKVFCFYFIFLNLLIYMLAMVGLHCCTWAFCSCGKWGPLFVELCGLFTTVAYFIVEHRL